MLGCTIQRGEQLTLDVDVVVSLSSEPGPRTYKQAPCYFLKLGIGLRSVQRRICSVAVHKTWNNNALRRALGKVKVKLIL